MSSRSQRGENTGVKEEKSRRGRTSHQDSLTQVAVLPMINPNFAISFSSIEGKKHSIKRAMYLDGQECQSYYFCPRLSPFIKFDVENLDGTEAKEEEKEGGGN